MGRAERILQNFDQDFAQEHVAVRSRHTFSRKVENAPWRL